MNASPNSPSADIAVVPPPAARVAARGGSLARTLVECAARSFLPLAVLAVVLLVPSFGAFALPLLALALWWLVRRIS